MNIRTGELRVSVMPAKAGIQRITWIPAFAGMTGQRITWIPAFAGMTGY